MQNLDIKGLFVEEDFLINYSNYNLTKEEAFFFLQLSYVSDQGRKIFDPKKYAAALNVREEDLLVGMKALYTKKILYINDQAYIVFNVKGDDIRYYTLRELVDLSQKNINRIMTSKEMDIVVSWFDKKFSKEQINSAFKLSKEIPYVNGILNNRMEKVTQNIDEDDILNYDWLEN